MANEIEAPNMDFLWLAVDVVAVRPAEQRTINTNGHRSDNVGDFGRVHRLSR
jgi:hypothetical protein